MPNLIKGDTGPDKSESVIMAKTMTPTLELTGSRESFQLQWTIPNWREVRSDERLVNEQRAIVYIVGRTNARPATKWAVGLRAGGGMNGGSNRARLYWQLLEMEGEMPSEHEDKIEVTMKTQLLYGNGEVKYTDEKTKKLGVNEMMEEDRRFLDILPSDPSEDSSFINSEGDVKYSLMLTLKSNAYSTSYEDYKIQDFTKKSGGQLSTDMATLFDMDSENSRADIKIISSDQMESFAHRAVLQARCPVFAAMFKSELSENKSGVVVVRDISGKTMKILLHYFYSGNLLPSWKDEDTVVEFTYAAGKYQMKLILDLLNGLLGMEDLEKEVTNLDVQLLCVVGKLGLKTAENRLLKRVVARLGEVNTSEELFKLFGFEGGVPEGDGILGGGGGNGGNDEKLVASTILKILDQALDSAVLKPEEGGTGRLSLLAVVQKDSLKNFEKILIRRFAEMASKFTSAEELFNFFGNGKQIKIE